MPAKPPRTTHSRRRVRREAEEIRGGGQISCDVSESICPGGGDYVKHLTIFRREACAESRKIHTAKIVLREFVRYRAEALTRSRHTP